MQEKSLIDALSDLYRGFPLDPASFQIRLLQLTSSRGELRGRLKVASLNDKPTYAGVSYVWTELQPKSYMICNGVHLPITSSLRAALLRFRQRGTITFWIDQICINQADLEERTYQVNLMTQIYTISSQVFVWLGDADSSTYMAFRFCELLSDFADKWLTNTGKDYFGVPFKSKMLPSLPSATDQRWLAFIRLLKRPWFHRVWVMQEVSNCAVVRVCCGHHEIRYSDLWMSLSMIRQNHKIKESVAEALSAQTTTGEMHSLLEAMDYLVSEALQMPQGHGFAAAISLLNGQHPRPLNLFYNLCHMRLRQCKRPEDKVNGVIAHLAAQTNIDDFPRADCELPVNMVYSRTARYFITKGIGVQVLQQAGFQQRSLPLLPSWCPDLSKKRFSTFDEMKVQRDNSHGYSLPAKHRMKMFQTQIEAWNAPPCETKTVALGEHDDTVILRARLINTVNVLGPERTGDSNVKMTGDPPDNRLIDWERATRKKIMDDSCILKQYKTLQGALWAYSRVLVGDGTGDHMRFGDVKFPCVGLASLHSDDPELQKASSLDFLHKDKMNFKIACEGRIHQRRVGVMRSGLIGIFPHCAEVGDRVCVVEGAEFPFVVRRKPRETSLLVDGRRRWTWELIGDCDVFELDVKKELGKRREVRLYLV